MNWHTGTVRRAQQLADALAVAKIGVYTGKVLRAGTPCEGLIVAVPLSLTGPFISLCIGRQWVDASPDLKIDQCTLTKLADSYDFPTLWLPGAKKNCLHKMFEK